MKIRTKKKEKEKDRGNGKTRHSSEHLQWSQYDLKENSSHPLQWYKVAQQIFHPR